MKIADVGNITINSSHRMGQAGGNYNRMLIARIPKRADHTKIFDNRKILKGTNYSINKQVPPEIDERRQFAWADLKKAKADKKPARFDGGTLVVRGTAIGKYQPVTLPATGTSLQGRPLPVLACGASDVVVEGQHSFKAWAIPARSVHDVREGLDQLLTESDLAGATHAPYAYRFIGVNGKLYENFESDGDINVGIQSIRILRELQADNVAIFIAHDNNGQPTPRRKKSECLAAAIGGAVMVLTASLGAQYVSYCKTQMHGLLYVLLRIPVTIYGCNTNHLNLTNYLKSCCSGHERARLADPAMRWTGIPWCTIL